MWIELLKPVDSHKAGEFLDVEDGMGKAYISGGLAKDAGDGPDKIILSRSLDHFRSELSNLTRSTADAIESAAKEVAGRRPNIHVVADEADKTRSIGDFVRNVWISKTGTAKEIVNADERLTKVYGEGRAMGENTGAAGGYSTPVQYETEMFRIAMEEAVFRPRCRSVPLGARQVTWPALDQYRVPALGQSAMSGGVQIYRKSENVQRTSTQPNETMIDLVANDLTALIPIGRDVMQDSVQVLDVMVPQIIGEAIGWREDWEILNGSGAGQLMGIYNSPATIQVTRAGGAGTPTFAYADAANMRKYLLPSSMGKDIWVAHPYFLELIWTLTDPANHLIFIPNIAEQGPASMALAGTLLGRPIFVSEKCPQPGNVGDIGCYDPSRYLLGTRSGLELGMSEHFAFDQDLIYFRAKLRNDGKPQLKKPITLADGAGTNLASAFVVLK